ncbi:MAG: hypothetical protein IPK19_26435 [Chloroflexi bacterium]|nr:hypothetical protein [Chloroflexota bacterium]
MIYFLIGGLWVHPSVRQIVRTVPGQNRAKPSKAGPATDYLITLITDVISALVVALIINLAGATSLLDGIGVGCCSRQTAQPRRHARRPLTANPTLLSNLTPFYQS